ncbi:MAG: NAD(P)H-dependent glycerol-3-phosphate dehydrogenase, partial [Eubacterium sp.]|nr:NAD(P)H-dependent glycerol-3-phosphate dehydrogenase [Eubacterium sp.]
MRICILGAGSWGIAIAKLLSINEHEVTVWSIDPAEIAMLNEYCEHKTKLPGVILSGTVTFTTDLEAAIAGKDIIVMAVPSPFVRSTAKSASQYVKEGQIIVSVSKGIEDETLMRLSEVITEEIPVAQVAVLSGPSHAEEVGKCMPTTVVVGCDKKEIAEEIQDAFMNDFFRVYISPDVVGIELGGALKNVIALAAGIADGLGCGDNTKAALITRGIVEISRLGIKMGGQPETFSGLSGIGDLIVTCASVHSRNRKAGYLIGQGKTYQEAMDEVKMVVEGVYSAKAALALSKKYDVSMPITEEVNKVLFDNYPAKDGLNRLLTRDRTKEVI